MADKSFAQEFCEDTRNAPETYGVFNLTRTAKLPAAAHEIIGQIVAGDGPIAVADGVTVDRPGQLAISVASLREITFPDCLPVTLRASLLSLTTKIASIVLQGTKERPVLLIRTESSLHPDILLNLVPEDQESPSPAPDRVSSLIEAAIGQVRPPADKVGQIRDWLHSASEHGLMEHQLRVFGADLVEPVVRKRAAKRALADMQAAGIVPTGILMWLTIAGYLLRIIELFFALSDSKKP